MECGERDDGRQVLFYEHGSRSARVAMGLLKDFTGAIQSDGYIVYEHFEGMEGKKLLGPRKAQELSVLR